MFQTILKRLLIGLCFALPAALAAFATSQAGLEPQAYVQDECAECHEIIGTHWMDSQHGKATNDPIFQQAWEEAGNSGDCLTCHTTGFDPQTGNWELDGVACETCHSPIPTNHPEDIMPTDISSRLCGTCHLQTHEEWSDSSHAQEDLSCVRCHNPHTTELRMADAQALCAACHTDEVHFFEYTIHALEGVSCLDCHLQVTEVQMGEGHGARHHTFTVGMETCANCHTLEMHYPLDRVSTQQLPDTLMSSVLEGSSVAPEPNPASPVGFAILAGLLGLASGMVLAPWSERWIRRING
jgi:predicted CXXCH cytochrome family protein